MKGLKKLVLASAIIAASSSAFAMQAMDDESMSATTGQDGLTIKLNTNLSNLTVKYVDRDGIAGGNYTHAGAVVISPLGIQSNNQVITIDAGGNAGTAAGTQGQLRIGIQMGTLGQASDDTIINLNNTKISVADAVDTANLVTGNHANVGALTDIITFDATAQLKIAAGGSATLLLGNRNATYVAATDTFTGDHMISLLSDIPSIALTGMAINDAVGGGKIGIGTLLVDNIHSVVGVDAVAGGLRIDTNGTTIGSLGLESVKLGDLATAQSIGDIYVSGITANNVITVTGH
jgi:hypothetical protein